MTLRVQAVRSTRDLHDFIQFPFRLYADDPHWVPPLYSQQRQLLDRRRNPFFQHADGELWLVRRGREVVGTISSHIDHLHNQTHGESIGSFGFFEVMPDYPAAELLLRTARNWVRERGMTVLRGPLNFSQNDVCGALIAGDAGRPVIMMPYNPSYYPAYFERFGLSKAMDLYAYHADLSQFIGDPGRLPPRLIKLAERVRQRTRATLRLVNRGSLKADIQKVVQIYNQAWAQNWGFVPLTPAEADHLADQLRLIYDPKLVVGVEVDGQAAGISLPIPDYNQVLAHLNGRLIPFGWLKALWQARSIDRARIIIFGVVPTYRGQGLEVLLIYESLEAAVLHGYKEFEFSWILENNQMMNSIIQRLGEGYGVQRYRTYRIYQMSW